MEFGLGVSIVKPNLLLTFYFEISNFFNKYKSYNKVIYKFNSEGTYPNDFDEDETVSDNAWEESGKFEGDLILNERQRRMIVEDVAEGLSRNGLRDSTKRWPNNEVIYFIQKEHFSKDYSCVFSVSYDI